MEKQEKQELNQMGAVAPVESENKTDNKDNKKKIDMSHFAPRCRNVDGKQVYDRLFIGWSVGSRPWLESHYSDCDKSDIVCVFVLGVGNVVFLHKKDDSVIYVNKNAGARALEYVEFYKNELKIEKVEYVDDLPTGAVSRTSRCDSVDTMIAKAIARAADKIDNEKIGF